MHQGHGMEPLLGARGQGKVISAQYQIYLYAIPVEPQRLQYGLCHWSAPSKSWGTKCSPSRSIMWGSKPKKIVLKLWGLMLFTQLGFGLIDFGMGMFILQLPHHCLWKTHHSLLDFTGSQLEGNLSWDEGYIWYILYHLNQISVFLIPDLDDSWM